MKQTPNINALKTEPHSVEKVVLFEPTVRSLLITANGIAFNKEVTESVKRRATDAILKRLKATGIDAVLFNTTSNTVKNNVDQLRYLHNLVLYSYRSHAETLPVLGNRALVPLPTVRANTRYDLPSPATFISPDIEQRYGAKYGVFVNLRDEEKSAGRIAGEIAIHLLVGPVTRGPGPINLATLSIVELGTGKVVWSYTDFSAVRDLSDPDGLDDMLDSVFEKFKTHQ